MNSSQKLDRSILKHTDKNYRLAISRNASAAFEDLLYTMTQGVILIYGNTRSGRSTTAKKLALHFYKKDFEINISYDFPNAYKNLRENTVTIIEDYSTKLSGKDIVDEYGLEQYKIYSSKRKAIVIIIGTVQISKHVNFHLKCDTFISMQQTEVLQLILGKKQSYLGYVNLPLQDSSKNDPKILERYYEKLDNLEDLARSNYQKPKGKI